jgi:hypothetical protein
MRINRGLLSWGLFFVVLGAVPLAVRQGLVDEETVAQAWTLWPLLLILGGVGLLLRRTPIEPLAGVATAATFGLIVGGMLASGSVPLASCGDEQGGQPFASRSGELGPTAEVDLQLNCGELTVRALPGSAWAIEGVDEDGAGPQADASIDRLEIDSGTTTDVFETRDRWTVALPTETVIELEARVNAGASRLELAGLNLARLDVGVNAGQLTLDLGGVAALGELEVTLNAVGSSRIVLPNLTFSGSVQANAAGGIRLCAPTGVGLRLTVSDSVASSHNYGSRGLVQDGNVWQTPDYDTASARIDLRTRANAGSFQLEPEGACDA